MSVSFPNEAMLYAPRPAVPSQSRDAGDREIEVFDGFAPQHRAEVTDLYLDAFGPKLARFLGRGARIRDFVHETLNANFAVVAIDTQTGRVVGVAGFRTEQGGLTERFGARLHGHYGPFGGFWRGLILNLLQTQERSDKLLVDGIAVAERYRGSGIGTALLHALDVKAAALGKQGIRLDVIDENRRAQALYARHGYTVTDAHDIGLLRVIFGFRRATQMTRML